MAKDKIFCTVCDQAVKSKAYSAHLRSNIHKNNNVVQLSDGVEKLNSAFRERIVSYRLRARASEGEADLLAPVQYMQRVRRLARELISAKLAQHTSIKINFEFFAEFILPKNDESQIKSFATKNIPIHQVHNFNNIYEQVKSSITKNIQEFETKDSGWTFLRNLYLEININKYSPLHASSFIELPKFIKNKRACINIKNNDCFCFLWSIMAALFPAKSNADRVSSYPDFNDKLNLKNMSFPMTLSDIKCFEKNNPQISVNVYGLKKNKIVGPLYKTQKRSSKHINLLFIEKGGRSHYCLIKDLTRLLRSQITKHHGKIHFCEDCLMFFNNENKIRSHVCGGIATVMPERGSFLRFKHFERLQDVPFVIYADFESLLDPCLDENMFSPNTVNIQKHIPAAFAYYVVCSYDNSLNKYRTYRGENCAETFLHYLQKDITKIYKRLNKVVPMIFTEFDRNKFEEADNCSICALPLFDDKVRDHCHLTGKFRGAAHSYCNIQFKLPKFVPVFFHNLSGYDCHLFIKQLGELPGRIKVIAKTKENYISFTKFFNVSDNQYIAVRFVDSFKFLGASLEKLVASLNVDDFNFLSRFFPDRHQFELLKRKGVYPYEYITSWDIYEENCLPSRKHFFSNLTNQTVSESDYEHALNVFNMFKLKSIGEYTDLYLQTDVLLLADIFEKFRLTCRLNYKLDPAFYITAPSLSFDAMLLKTKVKLELLDDLEITRMIQSGVRGGICLCSTRYAKSNHKYLPSHDPTESSNYLIYIDCTNLYGYAMCAYLPYSDFKLLNESEIKMLNVSNVPQNNDIGYILEVDLEYPEELHDYHNELPFCPQKYTPPGSNTCKLIPNLYDKFYYVIHYIHLQECLKHGLILKKIHRVISFKQSPYLKQYIDLNTKLRQNAMSAFEQDFFKLLNNSIFGKTLENVENRLDVKLVNQWKDTNNTTKKTYGAEQLIARPNFHSATIFSDNLVAIQMSPESVILDKPIYIGFTVLELSKSHMYNFHYSIMKPYYGTRLRLCYMDTDSFLYSIQTDDFYVDLKSSFKQYFDTSNYSENNIHGITRANKKVPGLFKDELGGQNILEFVGLRSKLYCIKTENTEIKKAKGVKKHLTKELTFKHYNNVLRKDKIIRKSNVLFKSLKHTLFTQKVNKVALSGNDDKRCIMSDRVTTYSWGYKSIL